MYDLKQQNVSLRNRLFAHLLLKLKRSTSLLVPTKFKHRAIPLSGLKKNQNSTYRRVMRSAHPDKLLVFLEELKFPMSDILSWCLQRQSSLKSSKIGRECSDRRKNRLRTLLHVCLQRRCESEWAVHLFTRPRSHVRWRHNFLCTLETAEILSATANRQCIFTLKTTIHL